MSEDSGEDVVGLFFGSLVALIEFFGSVEVDVLAVVDGVVFGADGIVVVEFFCRWFRWWLVCCSFWCLFCRGC